MIIHARIVIRNTGEVANTRVNTFYFSDVLVEIPHSQINGNTEMLLLKYENIEYSITLPRGLRNEINEVAAENNNNLGEDVVAAEKENNANSSNEVGNRRWTDQETRILLNLYQDNLQLVEQRKLKNKEAMWKVIASKMPKYNVTQVLIIKNEIILHS